MAPPATKRRKLKHDDERGHRLDVQRQDGVYAAETFKSNMFKLQVDELLEQVKLKYGKKEAPVEDAMRAIKHLIEQLPNHEPLSVTEAEESLKLAGVSIPFPCPRPPNDSKYKLKYECPSSINATGSYPLRTATRTDEGLAIDMVVTMPKAIFQEKDYLNYRYFYKRAYYMAHLAAGIKGSKEHNFNISFDCLNGNQLQPIVVIRPSRDRTSTNFSGCKFCINIILTVPGDTFPGTKLLPKSNCVRPREVDDEATSKPLTPTPFYNSTLQSDTTVTSYLKLLHATSAKCDAFKDACILGRIWLRQRGFGSRLRKGGFGNFEWAVIIALLLQPNAGTGTPLLSPGYSSYQLFKAMLQFLVAHDLSKKPFALQAQDMDFPKIMSAPVFFDGPRGLNVLFKMTPWSFSSLQLEAKTTIDVLGDSLFDQFDSTFILKTDLSRYRYDTTLEIPFSAFEHDPESDKYDEKLRETSQKLYSMLIRALTDRVSSVTLSLPDTGSWPVDSPKAPENQQKRVLIHFATNPANAHRTIDYGPPAENKQEATTFRKFWGDKSELRRFKDGNILESVVWSTKDSATPVFEQIIIHVLKKHVGIRAADTAEFTNDSCAHLVSFGRIQGQSGIAAFTPIMNAFSALEQEIRALEDLPLQVRHIRAADAQLRYASIEPSCNTPASIVLLFEGSARWPNELCAIQRTKIAFLLKISELLSATSSSTISRVGLENSSHPTQNQAYLDIAVQSGFLFRLRIHHDHESSLLDRQLKDKSLNAQSRESASNALAVYKRDFVQILSHTQAVQNLCSRYPALSSSIRLTKRWFASHLLLPHVASELIELCVVRTFLHPHPWPTPSCATTGFLRTLAWIGRWDWRHVPLIVDFSAVDSSSSADNQSGRRDRMRPEDLEVIQTRFEAWRRIDPAMNRVVLFAATNIDTDGNTWTDRARPEKVVAARMTGLAKAATTAIRAEEDRMLAVANGKPVSAEPLVPESLFTSQLQDYDLVIHILSKYTKSGKPQKSMQKFKNIEIQEVTSISRNAELEIVSLFAENIQDVFGDAILWFWDPESLHCIAGLWNPAATGQRTFKVKAGWNSAPIKSQKGGKKGNSGEDSQEIDIQINKAAVYNEIRRLGGELISRIDVNR